MMTQEMGSEDAGEMDDSADQADISLAVFGNKPPKQGDTIKLTVVSVDESNGTVTVEMPEAPAVAGSAGMADEFNQTDNQAPT